MNRADGRLSATGLKERTKPFVYCDKEMTDEYTPKAEAFISQIKEFLKQDNV